MGLVRTLSMKSEEYLEGIISDYVATEKVKIKNTSKSLFSSCIVTILICLHLTFAIYATFLLYYMSLAVETPHSLFNGKTVGIIGLGRIGSAITKRAESFGCPLSYYSKSENPNTNYKYYLNVIKLAANYEILIVVCALNSEKCHIINREVIDALGPQGVLVNIGRGSHVDEAELVPALLERRLGGAGLDVFENEPYVPEEIMGLENVVVVPHVGSSTVKTYRDMADLVIANLEAHVMNKSLLTLVDWI